MAGKAIPKPANIPDGYLASSHFGVTLWAHRPLSALDFALAFFINPSQFWAYGGNRNFKKVDWFWVISDAHWGKESAAKKKFWRNPWVEQMAEEACQEKYVALSGSASSGKTDFLAIWGIVNWRALPEETKAFVTSTNLKEAKGRVWGAIRDYWHGSAIPLPGKIVDSQCIIRPLSSTGAKVSERAGIELIAGEQSQAKEAVGKLIGFKQTRLLMLADELSDITPAILEAVKGNLAPGNPDNELHASAGVPRSKLFGFQMIAASNFKGFTDPFGLFAEPETSWRDITVETQRWRTKMGGVALRFDGLKSPNFDQPEDKWPIYGRRHLAEHDKMGRNTSRFWRFCRSFPAPIGAEDVVYTQNDLLNGSAFERVLWSERPKVKIAALDPSFTSGGDRCIMHVGDLGYTADGIMVLYLAETIQLREDVTSKDPFDLQILRGFRKECEARSIPRNNAAFDSTGSGISFGTLIQEAWGSGLLPVKFGGNASDLPAVSGDTVKPAVELYANRVTELWFQGKEYVRSGQLRGITVELADEMCSRKFEVQKGKETRMVVESKRDMKSAGLKSPDIADAYFILLELARVRFGFNPSGMSGSARAQEEKENPTKVYAEVYDDEVGSFDYEMEGV